LADDG